MRGFLASGQKISKKNPCMLWINSVRKIFTEPKVKVNLFLTLKNWRLFMNKNDLKKMALMGISGGILLSQTSATVEAMPIPGYPNQQIVQSGCRGGYDSGEMYGDQNMQGYSNYNGGYYDQGVSEGGYYQGGGNFPQADNYPDFGGYPVENGYNGATQGCGAAQGSYYSTQGPSGQGCSAMNQAPTYYSNPNATTSNQPGNQPGNLYKNYQNPQEMNMQQNQMPNQQNQPQQMNQGTGSQAPQKSSYNNNSRSRWYTAQADENATNSDQMKSYSSGTSTGSSYNRDSMMKNDTDENMTNMTSAQPMTEDDLLSQLNDQGKAMYNSLSPEGKRLALLIASRINDKNLAVREAAKKMAERRSSMTR